MAQQSLEDAGEEPPTEAAALRARGVAIPTDDEERSELFDALSEAVRGVLDDHDATAASVNGHVGHEYAQVAARCPDCDGEMAVGEPRIGQENSAYAVMECRDDECGYIGKGTYRLIDLEDEDDPRGSAVAAGKRSPNYVEYPREGE